MRVDLGGAPFPFRPGQSVTLGPREHSTRVPYSIASAPEDVAREGALEFLIKTDNAVGDKWVVTDGLKAGEKVIVEGLLKARPGAPVVPEPFQPAKAATSQSQATNEDSEKG